MATLTYGPIVDNARGSIGGVTFGQSQAGHTGRSKPRPPNPALTSQRLHQRYLAQAAIAWRILSDANKFNWTVYAATIAFTDSLGKTYHISPTAAFIRNYTWWLSIGELDPPLIRPAADGFPYIPAMSFDYLTHDIRMLAPVPDLIAGDLGFVTVFHAGSRTKFNRQRSFASQQYSSSSSFPGILAYAIDASLTPGQLLRAHLQYRQMDVDRRLSILQHAYVDFTST
jgi:hypothetical protein